MIVIIKPTATDYKTLHRDTESRKDSKRTIKAEKLIHSAGGEHQSEPLLQKPLMDGSIYSAFLGRIIL